MKKIFRLFLILIIFKINGSLIYADDINKLFPSNNEIPNWIRSGEMRTFIGDKLWEYIDGGAENYYIYGFKRVVTCDYKNSNKQIVVDIYDMKDPKNTFGIYSTERDPGYNFMKIGVQGYLEGTTLNFWKGNYYIKIITFDKSKEIKNILESFAKLIDKKITGKYAEPDFVKYFPKSNLVTNSVKYFPKDILGHSFMFNGFIADYKDGKDNFRVFMLDAGNQKTAQNIFMNYKNFINKAKSFEKDLKGIGIDGFIGSDTKRRVFTFYNSKLMAGVIGFDNEPKAIKLLKEIADK